MLSILNPTTLLSALAALPMLTSASPTGTIPAGPQFAKREISCNSNYEGYAFFYFSNRDENIYLAASNGNDALSFTELNNGKPILTSTKGDGGVRDPFILRSHEGDKFYILATDLCIGCGTSWGDAQRFGSRYLEIWESKDLINWSAQHHVEVSPDNYGNTWAPEAYYDDDLKTYVVYWASGIYDNEANPNHDPIEYQRMVYATTDDFITFSEPKIWQDEPPNGRIDSTVIKADGVYYRFTKATINGCADIVEESSTSLTAGLEDWHQIASCIGKNAGTQEVEGPSIFKTNCKDVNGARYILLADEFGGNGYVPLESSDLAGGKWTLRTGYKYPESPRHGTIIPLTLEELEGIQKAFVNTD
ncbi:Arabinanase levansucrase invertase [Fusarium circinatum]|uniref:Arabinanase levansucrase invertase n=1 Tax=Fusarium circinatum TaxID=48490 RepID=A0A8H5UBH6_FUSCI|nr:Arabinanase levansucrase invertase [Fusarium circinatum]